MTAAIVNTNAKRLLFILHGNKSPLPFPIVQWFFFPLLGILSIGTRFIQIYAFGNQIVINGAFSSVGDFALQLAKLANLKAIVVAGSLKDVRPYTNRLSYAVSEVETVDTTPSVIRNNGRSQWSHHLQRVSTSLPTSNFWMEYSLAKKLC
ncbi:hypothetical protein PROFUN_07049 [Planoprotostelium fungivorum]|uniref:Uncharacterized protein n=1 Tax=Planoprotostelium fungivorum TaxID=1890364 RepID=A0A2P6NN10_9EUKA|nr:hypothetical protein PROFUN_07049 [Planoprotostelium fungivorum]